MQIKHFIYVQIPCESHVRNLFRNVLNKTKSEKIWKLKTP